MRSSRPFKEAEASASGRLLVVLDRETLVRLGKDLLGMVGEAAGAGARLFWYRNHQDPLAVKLGEARAVIDLLGRTGGSLLVGESAEMAAEAGAQGVHLTSRGMPVHAARLLHPGGWIGRSCHSAREAIAAQRDGADYITLSPVFPPLSPKVLLRPVLGLEELGRVALTVSVPIFALGGVDRGNVAQCLECGAYGIAVMGALHAAMALDEVIRGLLESIERVLGRKED